MPPKGPLCGEGDRDAQGLDRGGGEVARRRLRRHQPDRLVELQTGPASGPTGNPKSEVTKSEMRSTASSWRS